MMTPAQLKTLNPKFDVKIAVGIDSKTKKLKEIPGYVDMTCKKCMTTYRKISVNEALKFTCNNCKRDDLKNASEIVYKYIETKNRMGLNKYGRIDSLKSVDIKAGKIRNLDTLGFVPDTTKVRMYPNMIGYKLNTLEVTHYFVGDVSHADLVTKNRFICKCSECGNNLVKSFSALYEKKTAVCEICALKGTGEYDLTSDELEGKIGKVYNNSTIVGVSGSKFIMRCGIHNKKVDEFAVDPMDLKFNTVKSWCPKCIKEYKTIKVTCPNCGEELGQMSAEKYFRGLNTSLKCKSCGESINVNEVKYFNDKNREYFTALSKYNKKNMGFREIDRDSEVAKYCMAYVGTDGNARFNCYCMKHRQELVLTDAEYEMYKRGKHKYCECDESAFISMIPTKAPKVVKTLENDAIEKIRPR